MELDKKNALPDVQSLHDGRNIAITRVGIRGVTLPITVESKNGPQHSVASLETTVSLPADQKGTHMSRFIALVEENDERSRLPSPSSCARPLPSAASTV